MPPPAVLQDATSDFNFDKDNPAEEGEIVNTVKEEVDELAEMPPFNVTPPSHPVRPRGSNEQASSSSSNVGASSHSSMKAPFLALGDARPRPPAQQQTSQTNQASQISPVSPNDAPPLSSPVIPTSPSIALARDSTQHGNRPQIDHARRGSSPATHSPLTTRAPDKGWTFTMVAGAQDPRRNMLQLEHFTSLEKRQQEQQKSMAAMKAELATVRTHQQQQREREKDFQGSYASKEDLGGARNKILRLADSLAQVEKKGDDSDTRIQQLAQQHHSTAASLEKHSMDIDRLTAFEMAFHAYAIDRNAEMTALRELIRCVDGQRAEDHAAVEQLRESQTALKQQVAELAGWAATGESKIAELEKELQEEKLSGADLKIKLEKTSRHIAQLEARLDEDDGPRRKRVALPAAAKGVVTGVIAYDPKPGDYQVQVTVRTADSTEEQETWLSLTASHPELEGLHAAVFQYFFELAEMAKGKTERQWAIKPVKTKELLNKVKKAGYPKEITNLLLGAEVDPLPPGHYLLQRPGTAAGNTPPQPGRYPTQASPTQASPTQASPTQASPSVATFPTVRHPRDLVRNANVARPQ